MARTTCVLFVDAYDSFSENIKALLHQSFSSNVVTIKIDTDIECEASISLDQFVRSFDAIVLGPGPGDPRKGPSDIGIFSDILHHAATHKVPVLGICLGFQTLCLEYGLAVQRLAVPCHGHAKRVLPATAHPIYQGIDKDCIYATCYNSLGVPLPASSREAEISRPSSSSTNASFGSSSETSEGIQTGFSFRGRLDILAVDEDGYVMAVTHSNLPFYGFQFHPESCKTNDTCHDLLRNWFQLIEQHNKTVRKEDVFERDLCSDKNLIKDEVQNLLRMRQPSNHISTQEDKRPIRHRIFEQFLLATKSSGSNVTYRQKRTTLDGQAISRYVRRLCHNSSTAMLESTKKGRYSIYALCKTTPTTKHDSTIPHLNPVNLAFSLKDGTISFFGSQQPFSRVATGVRGHRTNEQYSHLPTSTFQASTEDVVGAIEDLMMYKQAVGGAPELPFWGGFIGYMSYELGLGQLNVDVEHDGRSSVDDMTLLWVERSLIFDSLTSTVTIQTLLESDEPFIEAAFKLLEEEENNPASQASDTSSTRLQDVLLRTAVQLPDRDEYNKNYDACQEHLRAGNSYELCLTTEAKISLPALDNDTVYALYRNMHAHNPVPFGAFLDLPKVTILSTSPEEFLSWDRAGAIDMRPMKGTVKRGPGMTLEKATQILSTPKEAAENLMIADLIRHDLYSAVGYTSKVEVIKLCEVIEHETVYQLVSHIQASSPVAKSLSTPSQRQMAMRYGFKALTTSLPPGSMTGAPKKRSCEILHSLEQRSRGVYSGILGYLDVGGGGTWNVCIRTAFKARDGKGENNNWRIGAGGAITVLSDRQSEWEEMQTKLNSVLKGFTTVKHDV